MQYLSKAYQYYSGINPATLSGAIDVIVVRRQGQDGDEIYSCSPFHVRFGKLQVLRAGEKRVTLTLPDNLPAETNHRAPFWMKVGEAGEAFFVVETSAEVPEELQTSPVIAAIKDEPGGAVEEDLELNGTFDDTSEDIGGSQRMEDGATTKPFGQDGRMQMNGEPDFLRLDDSSSSHSETPKNHSKGFSTDLKQEPKLDMNRRGSIPSMKTAVLNHARERELAQRKDPRDAASSNASGSTSTTSVSPSSILNTASSFLPSFLSGSSTPQQTDEAAANGKDAKAGSKEKKKKPAPNFEDEPLPPNPLRNRARTSRSTELSEDGHHAETLKDYVRSHKARASLAGAASVGLGNLGLKRRGSATSLSSTISAGAGTPEKKRVGSGAGDAFGALQDRADERLPELKDGEGEAPELLYNEDVILDMAGYHRPPTDSASHPGEDEGIASASKTMSGLNLEDHDDTPEASEKRLRDNMDLGAILDVEKSKGLVQFAQDLLVSAGALTEEDSMGNKGALTPPAMESAVVQEIKRRLSYNDMPEGEGDEESADMIENLPKSGPQLREGFQRGVSEPPEMGPEPLLASGYTWEWGGFPQKTPVNEMNDPMQGSVVDPSAKKSLSSVSERPSLALTHDNPLKSASVPVVSQLPKLKPSLKANPLERIQSEPVVGVAATNESQVLFSQPGGRLKNDENDPYKFTLDMSKGSHVFELGLGGEVLAGDGVEENLDDILAEVFEANRITFKHFIEEPKVVDLSDLVIRYDNKFLTWQNASPILAALAVYRRSLMPPDSAGKPEEFIPPLSPSSAQAETVEAKSAKGYGWSRWWRRDKSAGIPIESITTPNTPVVSAETPAPESSVAGPSKQDETLDQKVYYAKTLRLTSDQLSELKLKPGPNRVIFSVSSSYSGVAQCSARIFLWEDTDHVVISDIDGTITKSDALGHVFAAIGRDWTHLGVAKLYTDVCNNGYKIMYLTSRAIGQADSTRDYLKSISQGKYQLPEGPVIMSPDRLFTSLHREVIMRKPELFKMACLRDIQRLFGGGGSRNAFYAGFGNRITDAMSYRSVNVPSSRIFTIDSYGEVKMELLELAGYKSSYIHMTDLVDQMFPPVHRKVIPEYTDFNFWRPNIADIPIPDLTPVPVSPALSATSDASGRLSMLGRLTGIARRASRQTVSGNTDDGKKMPSASSRPSSPLSMPMDTGSDYEDDAISDRGDFMHDSRPSSMPGSFDDKGEYMGDEFFDQRGFQRYREEQYDQQNRRRASNGDVDLSSDHDTDDRYQHESEDDDVYPEMFDDDLLATGEMLKVPY